MTFFSCRAIYLCLLETLRSCSCRISGANTMGMAFYNDLSDLYGLESLWTGSGNGVFLEYVKLNTDTFKKSPRRTFQLSKHQNLVMPSAAFL